ncbi:MAG: cell envelope integrity protein TolA, partial [Halioglobus sp.]
MNTFNLTFTGGTLPGYEPERVKAAFGKLFEIDDPARIDQYFAGQPLTLRRDLDRKTAAGLYAVLHKAGADVALEKIGSDDQSTDANPATTLPEPAPTPKKKPTDPAIHRGMDHEIREAHADRIDQSWPISSANGGEKIVSPQAEPDTSKEIARKRVIELEAKLKSQQAASRKKAELKVLHEEKQKLETAAARKNELEQEAKQKSEEDAARKAELEREAKQKAEEEAARKAEL